MYVISMFCDLDVFCNKFLLQCTIYTRVNQKISSDGLLKKNKSILTENFLLLFKVHTLLFRYIDTIVIDDLL